jgi:acylphosphatase
MTRRVHIYVSGRVQGVFFRAATRDRAETLGLTGWVRNLPDGRVEILAEGPAERIADFLAWCEMGPPRARVEDLRVSDEPPRGDSAGFEVRAFSR